MNVAVIGFDAAVKVMLHEVVPVQPVQLVKSDPVAGLSVSVTTVPEVKFALQTAPATVEQLIPAGLLVTVPVPVPASVTLTESLPLTLAVNVSVTLSAAFIVTLQAPVPEHAPPHPVNVKLAAGVAVSATAVPWAKLKAQVPGQLIPAGVLVTVPEPAAGWATLNMNVFGAGVADCRP